MVLEVVFRGVWDALTDSQLKMEWEEAALIVGSFLISGVIQWLMLKCRRKWLRYVPLLLMTVLWGLTEYMVAAESSMGAVILVVLVGYPVIMGWMGTIFSCILWHIRQHFRKTA